MSGAARSLWHRANEPCTTPPPRWPATRPSLWSPPPRSCWLRPASMPQRRRRELISLMEGALANARRSGARAALTGPVVRADAETVSLHLAALHGRPDAGALYRALARATLRLAGEEGRENIAALLDDGSQREGSMGAGRELPEGRTPPNHPSADGRRQGDAGVGVERGSAQAPPVAANGHRRGDAGVGVERGFAQVPPVAANGHRQGDAGLRVERGFAQARVQLRRAKGAARQSGRADARAERTPAPRPLTVRRTPIAGNHPPAS